MPRDFDRDKRFRGDDKKSIDSKEDFLDKYEAELARKKKEAEAAAAARGTSLEGMAALAKYKTTRLSKVLEKQFGPPLETQLVGSSTPMSVAQIEAYFPQKDDVREDDLIGQMIQGFREERLVRARAAEAAGLVTPGTVVPGPFVARSGRAPVVADQRLPHVAVPTPNAGLAARESSAPVQMKNSADSASSSSIVHQAAAPVAKGVWQPRPFRYQSPH
jgi:hypothetical protein